MKVETKERARGTRCCPDDARPSLPAERVGALGRAFELFAHPIRLQMLDVLARNQGRVCVCDLEAALPVKQPTISHHLRILRSAGVVESERQGNWAFYFVNRSVLEALEEQMAGFLDGLR